MENTAQQVAYRKSTWRRLYQGQPREAQTQILQNVSKSIETCLQRDSKKEHKCSVVAKVFEK